MKWDLIESSRSRNFDGSHARAPNGARLSCGAELESSQMQFYLKARAPSASGAC